MRKPSQLRTAYFCAIFGVTATVAVGLLRTVSGGGSMLVIVALLAVGASAQQSNSRQYFAGDAIGGTLAQDHQSRAMFHAGEHRRTYVAYMDDDFYARVTYYDYEADEWLDRAVLVDHCIADEGWAAGIKDGHNVPNIFITNDGFIHLFYGSHGQRFKYARSKRPEDITEWETGMRVGKRGTYPFLAETTTGELLVFYRYGPTGGYNNPFLAVQRTDDSGRNWSDLQKLVTFPSGCKISRAAYDPVRNRVHLLLDVPGPDHAWQAFHCMYAPQSGEVLVLGDKVIGPLAEREDFVENDPMISEGWASLCLHEGEPYFIFRDKAGEMCFGHWDGDKLNSHVLPGDMVRGLAARPAIHTEDGETFRVYGIRDGHPDFEEPCLVEIGGKTFYQQAYCGGQIQYVPKSPRLHGGDLVLWTTTDRGETWDEGKTLVDRSQLGHRLQTVNKVMRYPGDGPFLIVNEPTGPWIKGLEDTVHTHYDNPARKYKKLYAVDSEGHIVVGR